jgi:hypothetical protein
VNPWTRVLVATGAVVAAAVLLRLLPGVLVLLLFVGGVAYVNYRFRRVSKERVRTGGEELLGLKREPVDPFGILGYPLALFARTTDAAIDELAWGPWHGLDVHVFAVSFRAPTLPDHPGRRASLSCAMTRVEASLPGIVVEPQIFLTLIERPPTAPALDVGDAAFHASTNVWCDDPDFGRELLHASMREWLGSLDSRWGIDVRDRVVMVYGPRPDRPDVVTTLETLKGFLDHLPKDLLASHPPAV